MEDLIFGALWNSGVCVCVCVRSASGDGFSGESLPTVHSSVHTHYIITFPVGPHKSAWAQLNVAFSMSSPTVSGGQRRTDDFFHTRFNKRFDTLYLCETSQLHKTIQCTTQMQTHYFLEKRKTSMVFFHISLTKTTGPESQTVQKNQHFTFKLQP